MKKAELLTFTFLAALFALCAPSCQESAPVALQSPIDYISLVREESDGKAKSLQTAIVSFVHKEKRIRVDLIGAVHYAHPAYYRALNKRFNQYQRVLYELVAPKGTVPVQKKENSGFFGFLQRSLTDVTGLVHQIDSVNYQRTHFVHADLSFDDLFKKGKEEGETALSLSFGIMRDLLLNMNQQPKPLQNLPTTPADFLELIAHSMVTGINGSSSAPASFGIITPYLIDFRNQAALEVLRTEIENGATDIAIFYGVAHLPDFEARLVEEFGLIPVTQEWLTAWDFDKVSPNPAGQRLLGFLNGIQSLSKVTGSYSIITEVNR